MPSFEIIEQKLALKIPGIKKIHLSLGQYDSLAKKEVSGTGHKKSGRKTPAEHLDVLIKENRLTDSKSPLMILSSRNVLANLRCIAYLRGKTQSPIAVSQEYTPDGQLNTGRAYHVMGQKNGKLVIEEWSPGACNDFEWFISGVPVLWNDESDIYERIVTEAADHSHVWYIPRGNHPKATDETRNQWEEMQTIFTQHLGSLRSTAFEKLSEYAESKKFEREDGYTHNILGVDSDGKLYQLIDKGRLEDLGRSIGKMGAKRALCVDNGGSVVVQFFPKGIRPLTKLITKLKIILKMILSKSLFLFMEECLQMFCPPNHRPPGTTYLVIELEDASFS